MLLYCQFGDREIKSLGVEIDKIRLLSIILLESSI